MSLEQALLDNTAALVEHSSIMSKLLARLMGTEPYKVTVRPEVVEVPAVEVLPVVSAAVVPEQAALHGANPGDPAGTRYFLNKTHKSAYRIFPGDPHATIAEATEITGADFLAHQAAQAASASTASVASALTAAADPTPPAAPATNAAPPADATPTIDKATMVAKLRELAAAKGNGAIAPLLAGLTAPGTPPITTVPNIPAHLYAGAYVAAVDALAVA